MSDLSSPGHDPDSDAPVVPPGRVASGPSGALAPPPPPAATRLNKMGVVAAAIVMSVTLLIAALLIGGDTDPNADAETAVSFRAGTGRSFLDRPAAEPSPSPDDLADAKVFAAESLRAALGALGEPFTEAPGSAGDPLPYEPYGAPASAGSPTETPEEVALRQAMHSSLSARSGPGALSRNGRPDPAGNAGQGTSPESPLGYASQAYVPGAAGQTFAAAVPSANRATGRATDRASAFAEDAARQRFDRGSYIATEVEPPVSPWDVREGTLVEAYLLTGIHSGLPGEALAQVSRDVYDSQTQQVVLIPKGSRLVGTYDNQVAVGQGRLLVAWTRLIFPDGRSVRLPGLSSKDPSGANGLTGQVNRHRWRAFGNAAMLGVVSGGLAYAASRGRSGGGPYSYPGPGDVAAASVGTELSRVATEILRRDVGRRPTVRIAEGTRFSVFMNGDLALPPYQAADGFMQPPPLRSASARTGTPAVRQAATRRAP